MTLKIINSGSSGNGYILENDSEALVIECGCRLKEINKAMDFQISKIVGGVISHFHMDHSRYAAEYIKRGIAIYSVFETQTSVELIAGERTKAIKPNKRIKVGNFTITPFNVPHDANLECYGYLISHSDMGTLLFATDLEYLPYNFHSMKLNHIMLECNHIADLVSESYNNSLKDRVISTHMNLDTCKQAIEANKTSCLMNVILLHLSDSNSDEKRMLSEVKEIVGDEVNVVVADKGVTVNLDLCPF